MLLKWLLVLRQQYAIKIPYVGINGIIIYIFTDLSLKNNKLLNSVSFVNIDVKFSIVRTLYAIFREIITLVNVS